MTDGLRARADELATRLAAVEQRLADACAAAGRSRSDVALVAVSKFHPVADLEVLHGLGVRAFGESRDQEARAKVAELALDGLAWHFVGRLQSNKAGSVASYAAVVESVDRRSLVDALSAGAVTAERAVEVLVQVSLDPPAAGEGRGGAPVDQVGALADAVAAAPGLRLRGVMAVAPVDEDPAAAFDRLAQVAERLRADHPDADRISAGMTGDLEQAVRHGSTSVRVGTALFGLRPPALR